MPTAMHRIAPMVLGLCLAGTITGTASAQDHAHHHAAATAASPAEANAALAAAIADPRRDADRPRDTWRHPAETLTFFQVTPTMKVGEYAPGGGWYSRILGSYLTPPGKLVGLFFDPNAPAFDAKTKDGIRQGAAKFPADVAGWTGQPAARFSAFTLDAVPTAEKGTFDRILVLRMLHNMIRWNIADAEIDRMHELLKPGGMIGVEQHRARPDAPAEYTDGSKGYLREADVIRLFEAHGFELAGKSEANANPKDSADWPDGVWTLPPSLEKKDVDRAKYEAIGESDRMTLLFRKRG